MLTLAIEISNPSSWTPGCGWSQGVALGRVHRRRDAGVPAGQGTPDVVVCDDVLVELIGVEPIDASARHDDHLMPSIARLCERHGIGPTAIERVAVSTGPGGFTGLRVAVTAAKFIAEGCGAACVGVASASVVARRVRATGRVGIALASKGEAAFVTVFEGGREVIAGTSMSAEGLGALGIATLVGDRFLPEAMLRWAGEHGAAVMAPVFDPIACLEASASVEPVDAAELNPLYAREPEAVTKWRQLHPR